MKLVRTGSLRSFTNSEDERENNDEYDVEPTTNNQPWVPLLFNFWYKKLLCQHLEVKPWPTKSPFLYYKVKISLNPVKQSQRRCQSSQTPFRHPVSWASAAVAVHVVIMRHVKTISGPGICDYTPTVICHICCVKSEAKRAVQAAKITSSILLSKLMFPSIKPCNPQTCPNWQVPIVPLLGQIIVPARHGPWYSRSVVSIS